MDAKAAVIDIHTGSDWHSMYRLNRDGVIVLNNRVYSAIILE